MRLKVNGVRFDYKSISVLNGVDFEVDKGDILAILGPNGVGKTTLLKCMNAILRPASGSVAVDEENVCSLDMMQIARRFGYVPQRSETGRITAFDAILMGRRPHISWKVSDHDLKIVDGAIKQLNLEPLALRYVDRMSGGEVQKVSIARALVQEPKVLLFDEPTSSLDMKNQIDILNTIRHVVSEHEVSAVMTLHDLNTAFRYADKYVFLKNGEVYAAGGKEVATPEVIEAVYGVAVELIGNNGCPVVVPKAQGGENEMRS